MAVTPSDIKNRYKVMDELDDSYIQQYIDQAELEVTSKWGDFEKEGVIQLTMGLMAQDTYAFPMQLDPKLGESSWMKRFRELRALVGASRDPYGS